MKTKSTLLLFLFFASLHISYAQKLTHTQLKDSISKILHKKNIPGQFITVVSKDSVLFKSGVGYANLESQILVDDHHIFRIGSISKTFTAMAIMRLVKEGKLGMEDELKNLAPEIPFTNAWETTHPVRLKHLLEHKAGFHDMHFNTLLKTRHPGMTSLEEVQLFKNSFISEWKPGQVHSYSNPGYVLLGYIIEKITGVPARTYVQEAVLAPLGMSETGYVSTALNRDDPKYAIGYKWNGHQNKALEWKEFIAGTAGGMLSNADDMTKFVQYFLNQSQQDSIPLIGRKGVLEMEQSHSALELTNGIRLCYSPGLYNREYGTPGQLFKGHNGAIDGFIADFIYDREANLGIVVAHNGGLGVGNRDVLDLLVDQFGKQKETALDLEKYATVNLERFKAWEGEHRELNDSQEIFNFINFPARTKKIKIKGNQLILSGVDGSDEVYTYAGGNGFVDTEYNETIPSVYLTEHEGQKSLHYYESTYVEASSSWNLIFRIVLMFSLLAGIVITIVFLVQAILMVFKRFSKRNLLRTAISAFPFWLIIVSAVVCIANLSYDTLNRLGEVHPVSLIIFITTLLFPFAALFSIVTFFKNASQFRSLFHRYFYGYVSVAGVFLSAYCVYMGWFALRLWSY